MNFDEARPEYYEGLKVFQKHTDQQDRLKRLISRFFYHLKELPADQGQTALVWRDIGSGDGSFTKKILDSFKENGFAPPIYEGIEIDDHFIEVSKKTLTPYPNISIVKGSGFDGSIHARGPSDLITGFNALYFAQDLAEFKTDLEKALKPEGLGLFIQNSFFTEKAGKALIGNDYLDFTAAVPTEVFFPPVPPRGFELITSRATIKDIERMKGLSDQEKADTMTAKMIIDSMGGISTETDEGQMVARKYEERIFGDDYGGPGRYVSDNLLLVYTPPACPKNLKAAVKNALKLVRADMAAECAEKAEAQRKATLNAGKNAAHTPQT
ncbi:MAG: class I SAM-dependent methyltransferase [Alphaproteobacteria bacterium]|nr:class I SAM-dependent methyltransferase [Alphaproteobacteria bacterium]